MNSNNNPFLPKEVQPSQSDNPFLKAPSKEISKAESIIEEESKGEQAPSDSEAEVKNYFKPDQARNYDVEDEPYQTELM